MPLCEFSLDELFSEPTFKLMEKSRKMLEKRRERI